MTTEGANDDWSRADAHPAVSVEELARQQGVRPLRSVRDLARDDVFESDGEVDEFITFVHSLRHADLA